MARPWDELGIEPTRDVATIRRAYARRLKQTRPDDDPAGFMALRQAFEAAQAYAEAEAEPAQPPAAMPDRGAPAPPRIDGDVTADQPDRAETAAVMRIGAALDRRDVVGAAEALTDARSCGALPLASDMGFAELLLRMLAFEPGLAGEAVVAAAERLGWDGGPGGPVGSPVLRRLHARVAAERWLQALRKRARSFRVYLGSAEAAAARLLLGRGPVLASWVLPPEPPLRRLLAEYRQHAVWVAHAVPQRRVALAERLANGRYGRWAQRLGPGLICLLLSAGVAGVASPFIFGALYRNRRFARQMALAMAVMAAALATMVAVEVVHRHQSAAAKRPTALVSPAMSHPDRARASE